VTKHVLPVNLAQIRSAVPEIFHTQTKKSQTAPREPYACGSKTGNGYRNGIVAITRLERERMRVQLTLMWQRLRHGVARLHGIDRSV